MLPADLGRHLKKDEKKKEINEKKCLSLPNCRECFF